jgi:short-subunit dehydrogenase involved in D-alanine esterification of teichoic acids
MGKKVIATGREQNREKLAQLASDLPGLEFRVVCFVDTLHFNCSFADGPTLLYQWDLTELENLQSQVASILTDFPMLDTVFINAGIQNHYMMLKQTPNVKEVIQEMTTNLTAPILVAHYFAHHLLAMAQSGTKTNIFLTSSSLAYFPVAFYPTYCPTKAGIASFTKVLRMQVDYTGCKNMNVVEVVPPYVDTALNATHRDQTDALQGGKDKAVQPMPLEEYMDKLFATLEQTETDGSFKHEIGVGFGARGAEVWQEGFQKLLNASGMSD